MGHRPENRVTEDRERKAWEDKGQNKEARRKKNIQMIRYLTKAYEKLEGHLRQDKNPHYKAQHQQGKATFDYSITQSILSLQSRSNAPTAPKRSTEQPRKHEMIRVTGWFAVSQL